MELDYSALHFIRREYIAPFWRFDKCGEQTFFCFSNKIESIPKRSLLVEVLTLTLQTAEAFECLGFPISYVIYDSERGSDEVNCSKG